MIQSWILRQRCRSADGYFLATSGPGWDIWKNVVNSLLFRVMAYRGEYVFDIAETLKKSTWKCIIGIPASIVFESCGCRWNHRGGDKELTYRWVNATAKNYWVLICIGSYWFGPWMLFWTIFVRIWLNFGAEYDEWFPRTSLVNPVWLMRLRTTESSG